MTVKQKITALNPRDQIRRLAIEIDEAKAEIEQLLHVVRDARNSDDETVATRTSLLKVTNPKEGLVK